MGTETGAAFSKSGPVRLNPNRRKISEPSEVRVPMGLGMVEVLVKNPQRCENSCPIKQTWVVDVEGNAIAFAEVAVIPKD